MGVLLAAVVVHSLLLLALLLLLLLFGGRGELAVNYLGNKLLPPPEYCLGGGLQGWWCLQGQSGSTLLR
jgi:hypothetical protein